ncbi:MAG TPA: hypothetical protein VIF57_15065 [Polyangia bacterium]
MIGCGRGASLGMSAGDASPGLPEAATSDGDPAACQNESSDASPRDAASSVRVILAAGGAFNEVTNSGYDGSVSPSWRARCFLVSPSGHISASVATTFAGRAPSADDHRDFLFSAVTGIYAAGNPEATGVLLRRLAAISGVASSTRDDPPVFAVDVAFDPDAPGAVGSGPLDEIDIGFTWVRVYRTASGLAYQVLPGTSRIAPPSLAFDQPASVGSSFDYYPAISDNPSLGGGDFDYPAWIRDHVTW